MSFWHQQRPFVGRSEELQRLRDGLRPLKRGSGAAALVTGPPGIGKTRVIREFAAEQEQQGVCALSVRCSDEEGAPPYWPWAQLIRRLARAVDRTRAAAPLSGDELVSQLLGLGASWTAPLDSELARARFQLFEAVVGYMQDASRAHPLLLVIDDVHHADDASLRLLQFLGSRLEETPLLLILACPDIPTVQERIGGYVGSMARDGVLHRLTLEGLRREEVEAYVRAMVGAEVSKASLDRVFALTEGNPFFITEILRSIPHDQFEADVRGRGDSALHVAVPESVRDVLRWRMRGLSDASQRALAVGAVLGRTFSLKELNAAMPSEPMSALTSALANVVREGLLEEPDMAGETYQFTHGLVQQTLLDSMSPTKRAELHCQAAQGIERLYEVNRDEHVHELAYHYLRGGSFAPQAKLVRYCELAGERALQAYAYEEAKAFAEAALARANPFPEGVASRLLFTLGRAQAGLGEIKAAWESLGAAFDAAWSATETAMAVAIAEYPLPFIPDLRGTTRLASTALRLVPDDSIEASRLLARLGLLTNLEHGRYEDATQALDKALEIARRYGDRLTIAKVLTSQADVAFYHMHWRRVLEYGRQAVAAAREMDGPYAEGWSHYVISNAYWALGRGPESFTHAEAAVAIGNRLRDRALMANGWVSIAQAARGQGRWDEVRSATDRSLAAQPGFFITLAIRLVTEFETGNEEAGRRHLDQLLEVMHATPPGPVGEYACTSLALAVVARFTADGSLLQRAETAATTVLESPSATPLMATYGQMALALVSVERGDEASVWEFSKQLQRLKGTMAPDYLSGDRLLGILASAAGRPDDAVHHLEEGLAFATRSGYQPEVAWTLFEYARVLHAYDIGEQRQPSELIQRSEAMAETLGMHLLSLQIQSLKATLATTRRYPDGLTPREVEVARLLAQGKSNNAIADALVISPHTVIRHVSSLLSKTGCANRAAVASYVAQQGLLEIGNLPADS